MRRIHPFLSVIRTLSLRPQTVSAQKDLSRKEAHLKSVDKVQKSAEIRRRAALPCDTKQSLIRACDPPG